jgi:hypothetical protein
MYRFTAMVETEADAKFLASCLRGVAATNSIRLLKEDGTPVVDGDLKACTVSEIQAIERFIPDEIRSKMLEDREFLWDYAHMTFTGDGLEYDHAAEQLEGKDDEYLLECYSRICCNEKLGVMDQLRALGNERINKILDEEN